MSAQFLRRRLPDRCCCPFLPSLPPSLPAPRRAITAAHVQLLSPLGFLSVPFPTHIQLRGRVFVEPNTRHLKVSDVLLDVVSSDGQYDALVVGTSGLRGEKLGSVTAQLALKARITTIIIKVPIIT